jgi:hypothetical protein
MAINKLLKTLVMLCILQSAALAAPQGHSSISDLLNSALSSDGFASGGYSVAQLNKASPAGADERIPGQSFVDEKQRQLTSNAGPNSGVIAASTQPDLSIKADPNGPGTTCNQVSFVVTLTPSTSAVRSTGTVPVKVQVMDKVFGQAQTVAELTVFLPASGGSVPATIGFTMPADASFSPSWSNEITVIVDPDNQVLESDKTNDSATVTGTCSG